MARKKGKTKLLKEPREGRVVVVPTDAEQVV